MGQDAFFVTAQHFCILENDVSTLSLWKGCAFYLCSHGLLRSSDLWAFRVASKGLYLSRCTFLWRCTRRSFKRGSVAETAGFPGFEVSFKGSVARRRFDIALRPAM